MQRLELLLSLNNKLSAPLKAAGKGLTDFANTSRAAFANIGMGGAALWGVGQGIKAALEPAIEMDRALGEVKSLGVAEAGLKSLQRASLDFTTTYGGNAADFVRSSYDIQSAISGLTDKELANFTAASATLAKGTKSSSQTITAYMGTMYGIFEKQANAMGKGTWVKQVAGQTATAVKMFKTTGDQMSAAFTSLGASATSAGINAAEQFAVLGQLQATMSGSEAGTKYKSFLAAVGGAQKTLGLNFTNSDGTMKSTVEILRLIQGKFGDLSKVADSDLIKKAFGSDEAVAMIKLLSTNISGLKENITKLGNIKGMKQATEMAKAMADPWETSLAVINAIRIEIGTQLLPVLYPFIDQAAAGGREFVKWLQLYPNITRCIGLMAAAMLGLAAAGALVNIVCGVSKFIWIGLKIIWLAATAPLKILKGLKLALTLITLTYNAALKILRVGLFATSLAMQAFNAKGKAMLILQGLQKVAIITYTTVLMGATFAMKILAVAAGLASGAMQLLFSPITLIILAIAALSVGIYYLITRWDSIKTTLMDTTAFQWVINIVRQMGALFDSTWGEISQGWMRLVTFFSTFSPIDAFRGITGAIGELFSSLWAWMKSSFTNAYNWIIEKINLIPGVSIDMKPINAPDAFNTNSDSSSTPLLTGSRVLSAGPGGIGQQISNNSASKTDIDQSIRTINVNIENASPDNLNEWMELYAS
ncbi:phage tail tape measure protein [Plesiomonas shigelloides]|uniref:phage tail tape measure protein n=1 Tax=Plesiomonas shigelloides TaxID=703 RepID=UPI0012627348|nr:phage tail tape measure protein [Plesiomonas shigelloides]KAB7715704.1 phage tail tape measure protein [Plesiomonas shigelloides]